MSVDITLVYAIVVFMVAAGYLKRALFEPVGALLDQRRARLDGDVKGLATAQQEREARLQEYEAKIVAAKKAAWERRDAIRREAVAARTAAIASAREAGDREIALARAQIQSDTEAARRTLGLESQELGRHIAARILGRPLESRASQ